MKYVFEIKERAIGKQRPRYSSQLKRMYTPTVTRSFEEKIKWYFVQKYNISLEPSTKPFTATITAVFEPAKSLSKKKKLKLIDNSIFTHKPDADNIAKSILDSLNGLVYKDDSQVYKLSVNKKYGQENKIIVELEEME